MYAFTLLTLPLLATAQQVYTTVEGGQLPGLSTYYFCPTPAHKTSVFSYTLTETVRTATPAPTTTYPPYGLAPSLAASLLANQSTTSWGNWIPGGPNVTDTANPYGQASWSALWASVSGFNFTRGIYSTTVAPTPIPASELVLPPPRYFNPADILAVPSDFILGVAGAAAQIEGAIADEGRTPGTVELQVGFLSQFGGALLNFLSPDGKVTNDAVAVENYYLYKQDINRLAAIGIKYYSLSISWTRILPFALPGTPVNSLGLQHYDDLINYAISKGVQPIVTLVHFDAPAQMFGDNPFGPEGLAARPYYGYINQGYQNASFEDAWVNYGKIVMAHFADRIPIWVTVNEPQAGIVSGPAIDHIVKGHARLWHFYHEELKGTGKITMKMAATPGIPRDPQNEADLNATQHINDLNLGTFLDPLVLGKNYPDALKMTIQDYVPLSETDLAYMNGTMDLVSFDGYAASTVSWVTDIASCAANNATTNAYYPTCVSSSFVTKNGWLMGEHTEYITTNTAPYVRTQLNYLWNTYKKPVVISEFGVTESAAGQERYTLQQRQFDVTRSDYYLSYVNEALKAIWYDGVDVAGVIAWSFVDNWEWGTFDHQFGLQYNNRTSQERSYRRSFFDLVDFVESRRL